MSLYSIPTFVGTILAISIGLFVLLNNIKSRINIIFALFCFSLVGWLFPYTIAYSTKNPFVAMAWGRAGCISVDFAGPLFYHFVVAFLNLRKELKWVSLTYGLVVALLFLSIGTKYVFLDEPRQYVWGYYPNAGPLHILAIIIHSGVVFRSLILLYRAMKTPEVKSSPIQYNQIKYIFYSLWILVFPALTDYLPKYGIGIYPFGWVFVLVFCGIVAWAIIKHRLMDINIVFRGTLIYSILVGLITAIFVVMILLIERFFQGFAGYKSLLASALTAFIIALGFNPAKNRIQIFVDRYFFKGTAEEITQENIKLHQELLKQDRMKAVATLTASMAHEIKSPLTVIKTFTDYLPDKHNDQSFINNFIQLVKPQIEKIGFTVQQLLDFSKPTTPDSKPVNIYQILYEILELLSNDFIKNRIKPQLQFSDTDIVASADANQLKQVFLNLFLNSIEAMPSGGSLTVSGKLIGNVNHSSSQKHNNYSFAEISIQDTGQGISKENIKRIFQPFFTTKPTGTGLGLSIVQDILDQHKASIRVESEEGKWTKFIIRFPLTDTINNSGTN